VAKIALPYTIINGDPVDAGPVQSNYQTIENHSNQELIERGGTVAMTAQLKLVGDPIAALDAAPKQYVDQIIPIGGVIMYGGSVAPAGGKWLLCDGTEYQEATYPALAAVIGATAGRFNVPNLVNRAAVGGGGAYPHKSTGGRTDWELLQHAHSMSHDHGGGSTNAVNDGHLHSVTDHLHHPPPVSVAPHNHGPGQGPAYVTYAPGSGQSVAWGAGPEIATPGATDNATPGATAGMTGASDRPLATSANATAHSHTAAVPAFNGNVTNAGSAASGAGQNMPPYFAIAFLIRAA
jgi:microcystin-dependent protein